MLANTLIALLSASALLVSAAPVPRSDLEARIVGLLTCETIYTGPLQYVSGSDTGFLSFVGPKTTDGQPILHTTRANGEKVPSHDYTFKVCKSDKSESFMGSPPSNSLGLGHLELASAPGKCITANLPGREEGKKNTNFLLDECSLSDDSGQLLQTFSLSKNGNVNFLGHRQGKKPLYQLNLSKQKYTNVLLKQVDALGGGLKLKFPNM